MIYINPFILKHNSQAPHEQNTITTPVAAHPLLHQDRWQRVEIPDLSPINAVDEQRYLHLYLGYIPNLCGIIYDSTVNEMTTFAALIQLKNCVRNYWVTYSGSAFRLDEEDKAFLVDAILQLSIELIDNKKYSKLVKDIIEHIGRSLLPNIETVKSYLR